jgi:histidyl-tRNA synthetase
MREFGVSADDFIIRLSNREIWNGFLAEKNIAAEHATTFLGIIDKIERAKPRGDREKTRRDRPHHRRGPRLHGLHG